MADAKSKEDTATSTEEGSAGNTEKLTPGGSTEQGESEKPKKRRRKRKPVDPTSTRRSQRERKKRVHDDECDADNMELYKIKKCDWRRSNNWTIEEKQWLLEAVKRYGQTDLNKISRCIPTKKTNEVKEYMDRLRMRNKEKALPDHDFNVKAPIECWLEEMETLTSNTTDYSYALAQVLSLIQAYEPRELQHNTKTADYSAIYQFLVSLLRGHTPDQVRPVDAAVILDLLESLVKELQVMDTRVQRWVMKEKMRLLSPLVVGADRKKWLEGVRKALFNEFEIPEELIETPKTTAASSHKKPQNTKSASNTRSQGPAAARTATLTRPAAQGAAHKTAATVTGARAAASGVSTATSSHPASGPRTAAITTTLASPTALKSIATMLNKAKSAHDKAGIKLTLAPPSTLQLTTSPTQARPQSKTPSAPQTSDSDTQSADSVPTDVSEMIKKEPDKMYQYTLTESGELEVIPLKVEPGEENQSASSKQATPPEYVIDSQAVPPDQVIGTQVMIPGQVMDTQSSQSEEDTAKPGNQAMPPDQVTDTQAMPPGQMIDTQASQSKENTATPGDQATSSDPVTDTQAMPPDQMIATQASQSKESTATPCKQATPPEKVTDTQASHSKDSTATPCKQATSPKKVTDNQATPPEQMIDTQASHSKESTATSSKQATPPIKVTDKQATSDQMIDNQASQSKENTATPDSVNMKTNQKAADRNEGAAPAQKTESAPSEEARSRSTEMSRPSTASVVQHALYSINPLCIPIPLLNPKYKPI